MSLAGFGRDMLAEMTRIARQIVGREGTHLRWATVTDIDPVRIRYDGEANPSIVPPDSVEAGLIVGDRVAVVKQHGQALIVGRAGGSRPQRWPGASYAEAANTLNIPIGGNWNVITLPVGRFTQAPIVTAVVASGAADSIGVMIRVRQSGVTSTSFEVHATDTQGRGGTSTVINWRAVQMTPTSASG